jgi:peptidoglycan/LPS O-acetylase OafA/YrhL
MDSHKYGTIKMHKNRLLFLDIMRIFAMSFVMLTHISKTLHSYYFVLIPNIYDFGIGMFGVILFIVISGATLEYNHGSMEWKQIPRFFLKRIKRIYPIYWVSLVLGLMIKPGLIESNFVDILFQFSGFNAFIGKWGGPINTVGWFIGLIICLYALFPLLSHLCEKNPEIFIAISFIVSISSRYYFSVSGDKTDAVRWFPLCALFEFCLGIYIIKKRLYPKIVNNSKTIAWLSDLTFYVFLMHFLILYLNQPGLKNLLFYIISVLVLSCMAWALDTKIQEKIDTITFPEYR